MALEALQYYSTKGGPNSETAARLYDNLKENVVTNIVKQFEKTGQFWEHYSDKTGEGGGTRPFTGWTALVLSIMADQYN